jgi:hypothetical protein
MAVKGWVNSGRWSMRAEALSPKPPAPPSWPTLENGCAPVGSGGCTAARGHREPTKALQAPSARHSHHTVRYSESDLLLA